MPDRDRAQPLEPRRARFVELRAAGETIDTCAAAVGIDRSTAYRWLARPDVAAALAEVQGEGRTIAAGILASLAPRAAERLGVLLDSPDEGVSVRAAGQILDRAGLRGEPEPLGEELASVSDDGERVRIGDVTYQRVTPRPSGHDPDDGDPGVTDSDGEGDHECDA